MSDQPIHGVSAVTCARDSQPLPVNKRKFRNRIEDGTEVHHRLTAPILRDFIHELLTETERASRIRCRYHPASCRPQRWIPAVGPAVSPVSLRSAVDKKYGGIFLRSIEIGRFQQPILDRCSSCA